MGQRNAAKNLFKGQVLGIFQESLNSLRFLPILAGGFVPQGEPDCAENPTLGRHHQSISHESLERAGNSHDCSTLHSGLRSDHVATATARPADADVASVAGPDKVRSVKKVKVHPAGLTTLGSGVCRSVVAAGSRYLLQGRPGTRRAQAPGGTI